jgi:4-hydroxybenzoate polyprenyltransferase
MRQLRSYAELVRLPNVFTALADIVLGGFAVWGVGERQPDRAWWFSLTSLLAASGCLYSAGMVWNDFFDVEQDRRERPHRPIPSGRIAAGVAARLGTGLLMAGIGFAAAAGWRPGGWDPTALILAILLAALILLYDAWLKRTWAGPLGMGACRFCNVLLGLCVPALGSVDLLRNDTGTALHLASVVGVYIVAVTWFARTEARESRKPMLGGAAALMLAGVALAVPLAGATPEGPRSPLFPYLLAMLAIYVGVPICGAIVDPRPATVQVAVKRAIFGLVLLDATLATIFAGVYGTLILVLLAPAMFLGRWVYST